MSYIWQDFSEETTYTMADHFSPYVEVLDGSERFKSVNVFLRFYNVFKELIHQRQEDNLFLDGIENPILSFLADVDRLSGTDFKYIRSSIVVAEINNACFGEEVRTLFNTLTPKDKKTIVDYILLKNDSKDTNNYLQEVLVALFSTECCKTLLYWQESLKRHIMYSALDGSTYDVQRLRLVELLFLDVGSTIEPVWKYHFGWIGADSKMVIDGIQIV